MMKKYGFQVLRVVTCAASFVLVYCESSYWWIAVVPWVIFNIIGIVLSIPLIIIIGIGAGAAQADWMSDEFICVLIFVVPTVLAVLASTLFKSLKDRKMRNQG
jgi:membrane protein DedA with SNARE-associated domain